MTVTRHWTFMNLSWVVPLLAVLVPLCTCQSSISEQDIQWENDAPPWWCDILYSLWVALIHLYYAFKFTDYSLNHIHRDMSEREKSLSAREEQLLSTMNSSHEDSVNPNDPHHSVHRMSTVASVTQHHAQNYTLLADSNAYKSTANTGNIANTSSSSISTNDPNNPTNANNSTNTTNFTYNNPNSASNVQNVENVQNGSVPALNASTMPSHSQRPSMSQSHSQMSHISQQSLANSFEQRGGALGAHAQSVASIGSVAAMEGNRGQVPKAIGAAGAASGRAGMGVVRVPSGSNTRSSVLAAASAQSGDTPGLVDHATQLALSDSSGTNAIDAKGAQVDRLGTLDEEEEHGPDGKKRQKKGKHVQVKKKKKNEIITDISFEYATLARPLSGPANTKCCCLMRWSPRVFSWTRTKTVRLFLRMFMLISVSLAFVLWIEMFLNALLEFIITCIVHYDEGFWVGILCTPMLIFVVETALRYSWHALLISWQTAGDKNGSYEALDSNRLKKVIRRLKRDTRAMLRAQLKQHEKKLREMAKNGELVGSSGEIEINDGEKGNKRLKGSKAAKHFDFDATSIENKLQAAVAKHKSCIVGDFFIATCWRLQFCVCTVVMSLVATYQISTSSIFYQLLMRYMAIGGLWWSVIYFCYSVGVSYYARISTWNEAHPEIPKWVFFVFADATDYDLGFSRDPWVVLKISVALGSILFCLCGFGLGFALASVSSASGFFFFIGCIFIFYYLVNILYTCKPYAIFALIRDEIPSASNAFADEQKRITKILKAYYLRGPQQMTQQAPPSKNNSNPSQPKQLALAAPNHSNMNSNGPNSPNSANTVSNLAQGDLPLESQSLAPADSNVSTASNQNQAQAQLQMTQVNSNNKNGVNVSSNAADSVRISVMSGGNGPNQTKGMMPGINSIDAWEEQQRRMQFMQHQKSLGNLQNFLNDRTRGGALHPKYYDYESSDDEEDEDAAPDAKDPEDSWSHDSMVDKIDRLEANNEEMVMISVAGGGAGANKAGSHPNGALNTSMSLGYQSMRNVGADHVKHENQFLNQFLKEAFGKDLWKGMDFSSDDDSSDEDEWRGAKVREVQEEQVRIRAMSKGTGGTGAGDLSPQMVAITASSKKNYKSPSNGAQGANLDDLDQMEQLHLSQKTGSTGADAEAEENWVDPQSGRVKSELGRYTLRSVRGFRWDEQSDDDEKYKKFFEGTGSWRERSVGNVVMQYDKLATVFGNYKSYWLNVYRPYDEYDVDRNLSSTGFMRGFQPCKSCLRAIGSGGTVSKKGGDQVVDHKGCKGVMKRARRLLGKACSRIVSWIFEHSCNVILGLLVFLTFLGLYWASTEVEQFGGSSDSYLSGSASSSNSLYWNDTNSTVQTYSLCDSVYTASESDIYDSGGGSLSVIDVLVLSQLVYEQDDYNLTELVQGYFGSDRFEVVFEHDTEPVYFHMRDKVVHDAGGNGLDFVVVRGTSSALDLLQDISIFLEIVTLQILRWVFPFLSALPDSFTRSIVYYASLPEGLINEDAIDDFSNNVYEYCSNVLNQYETNEGRTTNLYVVGHSLGGAISQIVAANLYEDGFDSYISSFGSNSPGTLFSSAKLGFTTESLMFTSTSVLTDRDLVSLIDDHAGLIQEVVCVADSAIDCHRAETPICEMLAGCPIATSRNLDVIECYCYDEDMVFQFGNCLNATEV